MGAGLKEFCIKNETVIYKGLHILILLECGFSVLLWLPWSQAGCKEDLAKDNKFMECAMGFAMYFANAGESMLGAMNNASAAKDIGANLICSPEGKAAFGCIMTYIRKCPSVLDQPDGTNPLTNLEQIPGFDTKVFLSEGGIEAVCALLVGPCSEVKKCFPSSADHSEHGIAKRGAPASLNYYLMFSSLTFHMCGIGRSSMDCMLNALDHCPASVVDKVESMMEEAMKMATPNEYGIVSYQDTKHFILNECPKMPTDLNVNMCIDRVLKSSNFSDCNKNATMKYSEAKTCMVHNLSKQCIMEHLTPCGNDTASFFARNTHMIFPGIPSTCELTSASNVIAIPFQLLLLLLIISLICMD